MLFVRIAFQHGKNRFSVQGVEGSSSCFQLLNLCGITRLCVELGQKLPGCPNITFDGHCKCQDADGFRGLGKLLETLPPGIQSTGQKGKILVALG